MDEDGVIQLADEGRNEEIEAKSLIGTVQVDKDDAFETLISQTSADISRLANRLLGWPGDVDDIVQEVFLAAYTGFEKFRGESDTKTWLFSITINKCRTVKYKKILRLKFLERFSEKYRDRVESGASERPIKDEISNAVRKAVSKLPVKYREAIVLKYLQELKTGEIIKILNITENTLNVRLSRAKKILSSKLWPLVKEDAL